MTTKTNIVPFPVSKAGRYQRVGAGVYQDGRTGRYYWRPHEHGRRTYRKLDAKTIRLAEIEASKLKVDLALSKKGLAVSPLTRLKTVAEIAALYLKEGCPGRKGSTRAGDELAREQARVATLVLSPIARRTAASVTHEDCREYRKWRLARIKQRPGQPPRGDRQVDKELVTLSNIFRHAVRNSRQTGIRINPIGQDRERFRDPKLVRHCRDAQPANGDELHNIARFFLSSSRSEVFGWLSLVQAMTGRRINEVLKLRRDAKTKDEPGYVQGRFLWFKPSQTSKGVFPYAEIHSALAHVLEAMAAWWQKRYPDAKQSPWYFPSPKDPSKPVGEASLTHALVRAVKAMELPKDTHRTSHGFRSYYVNVLRSQGKPDAEIALKIGQKTAGKLIVEVYGEVLPYKLSWLPATVDPAWKTWLEGRPAPAPVYEQLDLFRR
ncbi:MAG: hypothetical protein AB1705_13095 [Verrucomicrobiota bacterium]